MTRTTIQETLEKTGILVIDGSMSTALEQLGCDLNDSLWTATALDRQPELVEKVHENYFAAGADCGITCSYQATIPGLMAKGHTLAEAGRGPGMAPVPGRHRALRRVPGGRLRVPGELRRGR